MTRRSGLDLTRFETAVEPAAPAPDPVQSRAALNRRAIDQVSEFRRRDPADEITITIRGPSAMIKRFKALCRTERRSQAEVLERLLDAYGDPKL